MEFQSSTSSLQDFLGKLHVLFMHAEIAHWNVVGIHFHSVHEFFEEQYKSIFGMLDDTAERIRVLDTEVNVNELFQSVGAVKDSSYQGVNNAEKLLELYKEELNLLINGLYKKIKACEDAGDVGTADFLTGILQQFEKSLWMCRALLT